MKPLRTRRGELQLPVDTYRHDDGRTVTLVGMVHVADPVFYDDVAAFVADRERQGDLVQFERITTSDPEDATEQERALVARLRAARNLHGFADLLGLTAQHHLRLPVQPTWVNTDMSATELLRALCDAEGFATRQEKATKGLTDMTDDERRKARKALRWTLRHLGWLYPLLTFAASAREHYECERAAIVDQRNAIAVTAITAAGRSVTALWGAAHLDGIGAGLAPYGFRLVSRTWQTAVRKGEPQREREVAA